MEQHAAVKDIRTVTDLLDGDYGVFNNDTLYYTDVWDEYAGSKTEIEVVDITFGELVQRYKQWLLGDRRHWSDDVLSEHEHMSLSLSCTGTSADAAEYLADKLLHRMFFVLPPVRPTVSDIEQKNNAELVKSMDDVMRCLGGSSSNVSFLWTLKNGMDDDDYMDIASDRADMNVACKTFNDIISSIDDKVWDDVLSRDDVSGHANLMKSMDVVLRYLNDEEAIEPWLWLVPDGAYDEDYLEIAGDRTYTKDVCSCFTKIVSFSGKDGWFTNYSYEQPFLSYGIC